MNTLIYFRTWALTTSELITFTTDTERQITEAGGAEVLGITSLYPILSELSLNLRKTFQSSAKNPVTADKEAAEGYRDNRYSALVAFVRNASHDSNAEISAAAESIMDVINNVGNPVNIGDSKATAELYNLVARLSPLSHQINLIGASARLQELENANREFERLQNEWYKAGAKKISGNILSIRQQLAPVYKSIIYRINALIEINGDAQYKSFVDAHNKMIEYYRNIVAQRKGRKKAVEKENSTTESN
jgi:hypothetical protein